MKSTLLILPFLIFNSIFSMEDNENTSEFYEISEYSDDFEYNELCQKAVEIYFKKNNYALHQEITRYVKDRLRRAKHSPVSQNQEALRRLHDSDTLIKPKKKKDTKDHEFHEWLNRIITESIEEAFKNKEIEAEKHKEELEKSNREYRIAMRKAKIAACSNILTGIITSAVAASVTMAITYK